MLGLGSARLLERALSASEATKWALPRVGFWEYPHLVRQPPAYLLRRTQNLSPDDPVPKVLAKLTKVVAFPDRDKNGVRWAMELGVGIDRPDKQRFKLFGPVIGDFNFDRGGHWTFVHAIALDILNVRFWLGAKDTN